MEHGLQCAYARVTAAIRTHLDSNHVNAAACWRQGNRIWHLACLRLQKNPSLRAGFGMAIQGHADKGSGSRPWIAASQAFLAMTRKTNATALVLAGVPCIT